MHTNLLAGLLERDTLLQSSIDVRLPVADIAASVDATSSLLDSSCRDRADREEDGDDRRYKLFGAHVRRLLFPTKFGGYTSVAHLESSHFVRE